MFFEESETSKENKGPSYNQSLYHYSVSCSVNTVKEWLDPHERMKCYFAYQEIDGSKHIVGFIHFKETSFNNKSVVYIAQAGVMDRSHGIGRRLMECVLSHYPAETHYPAPTSKVFFSLKFKSRARHGF